MTGQGHSRLSARKSPRQARSSQLVEDILTAAARVLAEHGAHRFTTARVAERAGVSVGSLYQYFPNKASILFRLQTDEWRQNVALLCGILEDRALPPPEHTINLTLKRGVRSALEYAASGDIAKARAVTNPNVAPHLEFVDMAGHGYAVMRAGPDEIDTEFVCIVRPITRATTPDGGSLRYRVSHRASMWRPGTPPKLEQRMLDGDAQLSV